MKRIPRIQVAVTCLAVLLIFVSCRTSEKTTGSSVTPEVAVQTNRNASVRPINPSLPLISAIRNLPGVTVSGGGTQYQIRIRGVSSFSFSGNDNNPLFVVNGIPFGYSYSDVAGSVSMSDVSEVRVIRGTELTRRFGSRGSSGVIEIITKQSNTAN